MFVTFFIFVKYPADKFIIIRAIVIKFRILFISFLIEFWGSLSFINIHNYSRYAVYAVC